MLSGSLHAAEVDVLINKLVGKGVLSREEAAEILPLLDRAEQALFRELADVEGVRLERKKFSVASGGATAKRCLNFSRICDGIRERRSCG